MFVQVCFVDLISPVTVADNVLRVPPRRPAPEVTAEVNEPSPEPVRRTEPRVENPSTIRTITPETRQFASATAPASMTHLSSITSSISSAGERVTLTAATPIRDYRVYFRNGRFFLSLPQTRLDVFQDGLLARCSLTLCSNSVAMSVWCRLH